MQGCCVLCSHTCMHAHACMMEMAGRVLPQEHALARRCPRCLGDHILGLTVACVHAPTPLRVRVRVQSVPATLVCVRARALVHVQCAPVLTSTSRRDETMPVLSISRPARNSSPCENAFASCACASTTRHRSNRSCNWLPRAACSSRSTTVAPLRFTGGGAAGFSSRVSSAEPLFPPAPACSDLDGLVPGELSNRMAIKSSDATTYTTALSMFARCRRRSCAGAPRFGAGAERAGNALLSLCGVTLAALSPPDRDPGILRCAGGLEPSGRSACGRAREEAVSTW